MSLEFYREGMVTQDKVQPCDNHFALRSWGVKMGAVCDHTLRLNRWIQSDADVPESQGIQAWDRYAYCTLILIMVKFHLPCLLEGVKAEYMRMWVVE